MPLISFSKIDNFDRVRSVRSVSLSEACVATVRELHEADEIEPWILGILSDTNATPHGPSEIVDILTHKISVGGREGMAAFILKGRSFPTVRPKDVAHQIFRLERIKDLSFAVFAATGNVLDDVKEQFISTTSRLGCDYVFMDAGDFARLFVAFGSLCPRDGNRIRGGTCECGYTPAFRTSNVLQQEALSELASSHALGQKAGAVILPTGAGKTRVAALDVKRQDPRICFYVAHSHEILADAEKEFVSIFSKNDVRRFQSRPNAEALAKINFMTIQSLARNLAEFANVQVEYLIVDEFHHAAASSYRKTIEHLRPSFLLGLTATPFRGDRQDVLAMCGNNVIVCIEMRQGIELGVLCPYHYFGCFDDVNYTNIKHNGNQYDVRDLERALIIPERHVAVLEKWREKADGKATLAFCCSHRHASIVASAFCSAGISAATYLSTTGQNIRAELRDKFRSGEIKVLCVVDILNEGIDLPFAECLLFLRPTESKRIFLQQLGRGLRHFLGKEKCVVLDFIGNFKNAYKIVEFLGLDAVDDEYSSHESTYIRSRKDILNLPSGCAVDFDDRVIDLFGHQTLDPAYATRTNIGKILIYQYTKLGKHLGRKPTKRELDRQCLLGSHFYESVFGSWSQFEKKMASPSGN